MNSKRRALLSIVLLVPPLLIAGKCDEEGNIVAFETFTGNVLLFNNDLTDSLHILAPGESFAPANKLAPGHSRFVTMTLEQLERYEFRAGQNGEVEVTKTCLVEENADASDLFNVIAIAAPWTIVCGESFDD